ncbi:hypothetical protein ACFFRR_006929 [Megaselia abdita]
MCQVKRCCCFSLRSGCLIIGAMDMILYTIIMVTTSLNISKGTQLESTGAPVLVGASFSIIAATLLIFGVMTESKGYLRFWLFLKGIVLIMIATIFVWIIIALIVTDALAGADRLGLALFITFICVALFIIGLSVYWWHVVKSYRRQLKARLPL